MNVKGLKTCLRHIIRNMPLYKEGSPRSIPQLAVAGNQSDNSPQEEESSNHDH